MGKWRAIRDYFSLLDPWLLFFAGTLFVFGILAIGSVDLALDTRELALKQFQNFGFALVLMFSFAMLPSNFFKAYAKVGYWAGILTLILLIFFGRTLNGTTGWFIIFGVSIQPLEFMKVALILELASYLSLRVGQPLKWGDWWQVGYRIALPTCLVFLQPDLGGAIILVLIGIGAFYFGGVEWRRILIALTLGITLLTGGIFLTGFQLADYQRERFTSFLNPAADPLGAGYNLAQAKIAIGSGRWFGRGIGGGSQSQLNFLPESQTDFIFAVLAESLGFVGITIILLLHLGWWGRWLYLAMRADDPFSARVLALSLTLFAGQALLHIGVNLGALPATGVTLPFMSYGGSSLLAFGALLGIGQSCARTRTLSDQSTLKYL